MDLKKAIPTTPGDQLKDRDPVATVEKIRQILAENHIQVEEFWRETCVPYCHSMAVRVVGTSFSVNGKGLTKEFARASGYGELMERLQFGTIGKGHAQKTADLTANDPNTVKIPAQELLAGDLKWYQQIAQRVLRYTGSDMTAQQVLLRNADRDGKVACSPFYCLTTGTPAHFPNEMRGKVYTTNGCAAGNTPEEALVQAISEIVERSHMIRMIEKDLSLPDIPEEILQGYETAYDIITYIRAQGYQVSVKDCSLGTGFPVVCVCMIDQRTGRYHTHLGAYPIFKIALERSLTESFQGYDIQHVARFQEFLPRKRDRFTSISNEVTQGSWEKSPLFFVGDPQFSFDPDIGFPGPGNKELLRQCIAYFKNMGYDILVRDCSSLGFPTFQVIIPGYSECFLARIDPKTDDLRYAKYARDTLRDPSAASIQDMLGLLMHIEETKHFTANINGVHGFLSQAKLSINISRSQDAFLYNAAVGYVYLKLGRTAEAIGCIRNMVHLSQGEDKEYLLCLQRAMSLSQEGYPATQVQKILDYFHRPAIAELIRQRLDKDRDPLAPYILHCDMHTCSSCPVEKECGQHYMTELTTYLLQKRSQLDFQRFQKEMDALI